MRAATFVRLPRLLSGLCATFGTLGAIGAAAVACTSPPEDLPPVVGTCDAQPATLCAPPIFGGGTSSAGDAGPPVEETLDDGGVIYDDGSACGIFTALMPSNPACAPCLGQFCCTSASACAGDTNCEFLVGNCTGCSSASSACAVNCAVAQESVALASSTSYDDLSTCLNLYCVPQCPALNIFEVVVDP